MALEYSKQTIQARCGRGGQIIVPVEAMVGEGTGLAYHPNLSLHRGGYRVTHVASGYAVFRFVIPTESGVRTFLEKLAELDHWQIDSETFILRMQSQGVRAQIDHARTAAYPNWFLWPLSYVDEGKIFPEHAGVDLLESDLAQDAFVSWLQTFGPDYIVGRPQSSEECPLALYLQERTGHLVHVNGVCYCVFGETEQRFRLPAWAMAFVQRIDWEQCLTVTASAALDILQQASMSAAKYVLEMRLER